MRVVVRDVALQFVWARGRPAALAELGEEGRWDKATAAARLVTLGAAEGGGARRGAAAQGRPTPPLAEVWRGGS